MNEALEAQKAAAMNRAEISRTLDQIAASYRALFASDSGKIVLADLKKHFNPTKPRFTATTGFDLVKAAKIDGQADVMNHILAQLERATNNNT